MIPWTPAARDAFIYAARTSTEMSGYQAPYQYRVYPKNTGGETENPRRSAMIEALARTIYTKNPTYRQIPFKFYEMLIAKIRTSTFVNRHFMSDFCIVLKGSNAYCLLLENMRVPHPDFNFSDLDLVIFINPYLEPALFQSLRISLNAILLQVISQYKRTVDHMFFLNKPSADCFMDAPTIALFKEDLKMEFANIEDVGEEIVRMITPFEDDDCRNACSKNSFVLMDSLSSDNKVVRIEVPHFDKCERIPLRHTPCMVSHNSSISFCRTQQAPPASTNTTNATTDATDTTAATNASDTTDATNAATHTNHTELKGEFDLYRIKLMGMCIDENDREHIVPMDFIDVSIPAQVDAELIDFWNHGRCMNILDPILNMWMVVPDVPTCVRDLYKMLNVYECPEHKRAKRECRYAFMQSLGGPSTNIQNTITLTNNNA